MRLGNRGQGRTLKARVNREFPRKKESRRILDSPKDVDNSVPVAGNVENPAVPDHDEAARICREPECRRRVPSTGPENEIPAGTAARLQATERRVRVEVADAPRPQALDRESPQLIGR
jgi:hypothetical protein